jgi:Cytochrome B6-F complex subunit VI (PetL)
LSVFFTLPYTGELDTTALGQSAKANRWAAQSRGKSWFNEDTEDRYDLGETEMGGVVAYFLFYGVMLGLAIGLYFGLRTFKLI